jgi:hypothetical protein
VVRDIPSEGSYPGSSLHTTCFDRVCLKGPDEIFYISVWTPGHNITSISPFGYKGTDCMPQRRIDQLAADTHLLNV